MDDFKKPYEYNEDKRGPILYFVIMLVSLDILLAVMYTVQVSKAFNQNTALYYGSLAINILYFLFIIYTAVTCFRLKRNLVTISKLYLFIRAIYSTISAFIVFFHIVNKEGMVGAGMQYESFNLVILQVLIVPLTCVILISVIWYLYFTKSKRCREITDGSFHSIHS
jgi:hypothetical protein